MAAGEAPTHAHKDASQLRQKQMLAEYFTRLSKARETGTKIVYTFVPGNLTELLLSFDILPVLPEINALQSGMGKVFDEDRLRELLACSARAENDFVWVLESAKNVPSPIDAYFGGVYYIGPIFTAFRGTPEAVDYYRELRSEVVERLRLGKGPVTPDGEMEEERYRLVVEGPPNWTSFREFWKMFADEKAVVVASGYPKGG